MSNTTVPQTPPKLIAELEKVLHQLLVENRKLLVQAEAQQSAMKVLDTRAMEKATEAQEFICRTVGRLDLERQELVRQLGRVHRLDRDATLTELARWYPNRRTALTGLRSDLRGVMTDIARRNFVVGRVGGAVLGHLNTSVRILAGAVGSAGLYTKSGTRRIAKRIGVMEAVG